MDRETKPEIAGAVSLDRYGFDGAAYRAGEHELKSVLPDAKSIGTEVLPSGLRQGETAVLRPLFEAGQSDPRTLRSLVVEVRLIGQVQTFDHHLSSLGSHEVPVLKAALFLQLRQMTLQLVVAWIRAIETVVTTRQGDEVIPDLGSVLNASRQKTIMSGSVRAVFERASQLRQKGSALMDARRRVAIGREQPPAERTHKGTQNPVYHRQVVSRSLVCYSHALPTDGPLSGSRLSVKERVCEHFFQRRKGRCIPPLK